MLYVLFFLLVVVLHRRAWLARQSWLPLFRVFSPQGRTAVPRPHSINVLSLAMIPARPGRRASVLYLPLVPVVPEVEPFFRKDGAGPSSISVASSLPKNSRKVEKQEAER